MGPEKKILLIETDPRVAGDIAESLAGEGAFPVELRRVASLAEAADASEAERFDLLLLDLAVLTEARPRDVLLFNHRAPLVTFLADRAAGQSFGPQGRGLAEVRQAVTAALTQGEPDPRELRRSLYDSFTGLPTQALLLDLLNQALARAQRSGLFVALVPFKLYGLENLTARFGPAEAETIYKGLLRRLAESLRASDVVASLGGADFAILMEVRNGYGDAVLVAERVREIMSDRFDFEAGSVDVTMTIQGPVMCDAEVDDLEPLLRDAAAAFPAPAVGRLGTASIPAA